jgi:hypothetical protein
METDDNKLSISVHILVMITSIIDVASKRGAFEGRELTFVGQTRDTLQELINVINESVMDHEYDEDDDDDEDYLDDDDDEEEPPEKVPDDGSSCEI